MCCVGQRPIRRPERPAVSHPSGSPASPHCVSTSKCCIYGYILKSVSEKIMMTSQQLVSNFLSSLQVCVAQCPSGFSIVNFLETPQKAFNQNLCLPSTDLTSFTVSPPSSRTINSSFLESSQEMFPPTLFIQSVNEVLDEGVCPFFVIPTTPGESSWCRLPGFILIKFITVEQNHMSVSHAVLGRCLPNVAQVQNVPSNFTNVEGLPGTVNETISVIQNGTR